MEHCPNITLDPGSASCPPCSTFLPLCCPVAHLSSYNLQFTLFPSSFSSLPCPQSRLSSCNTNLSRQLPSKFDVFIPTLPQSVGFHVPPTPYHLCDGTRWPALLLFGTRQREESPSNLHCRCWGHVW